MPPFIMIRILMTISARRVAIADFREAMHMRYGSTSSNAPILALQITPAFTGQDYMPNDETHKPSSAESSRFNDRVYLSLSIIRKRRIGPGHRCSQRVPALAFHDAYAVASLRHCLDLKRGRPTSRHAESPHPEDLGARQLRRKHENRDTCPPTGSLAHEFQPSARHQLPGVGLAPNEHRRLV